jgi:hypothetical protein
VEFSDGFCNCHQGWHRPERFPAKIGVGSGGHDSHTTVGKRRCDRNNRPVEKLHFVNRCDLCGWSKQPHDLRGGIHWLSFHRETVMCGNRVFGRVPVIQVGLEHLDALPGNDGTADAPNQFLSFSAEHYAGDHFDPSDGRHV